ncbi:unnamed protein product, partial [marine sediment metagenome]
MRIVHILPLAVLMALLLWVPLPFASVTPWGVAILETVAFVTLAGALLAPTHLRASPAGFEGTSVSWSIAIPMVALGSIALLGFGQSAGWSPAVITSISPEHGHLQNGAANL